MGNNVLENIIRERDYTFKKQIFKVVKEYDLTLNNLILILFFVNQNIPTFNVALIKSITHLEDKDIFASFTELSNKGLISVKMIKENNKSIETINLDRVYQSMVSDIKDRAKEDSKETIFEIFEKEFGRCLSPMEYEIINSWIKNGSSEEIILGALKEATYNGVSNFRYIDKIIYDWNKKGFKTMEDVSSYLKRKSSQKEEKILFDYNWLEDE